MIHHGRLSRNFSHKFFNSCCSNSLRQSFTNLAIYLFLLFVYISNRSLNGSISNLVLNNMDCILSNIIIPDNIESTLKTYQRTGEVSFQLVVSLRSAAYFAPQPMLYDRERTRDCRLILWGWLPIPQREHSLLIFPHCEHSLRPLLLPHCGYRRHLTFGRPWDEKQSLKILSSLSGLKWKALCPGREPPTPCHAQQFESAWVSTKIRRWSCKEAISDFWLIYK
jgi:hypothetical protein